jgi:hypothetical protein
LRQKPRKTWKNGLKARGLVSLPPLFLSSSSPSSSSSLPFDSILSYSFPFLEAMMKVQKDSKISTKNLGRMNKDERYCHI